MPQIDPTWFASQLFWLALTFTLLYVVLAKLVLPPLMDVLEGRKLQVASDVDHAQQCKSQAEQARSDYERVMADARARSQKILSDAIAESTAKTEQAKQQMGREIDTKILQSQKKIAERKNELLVSLTPVASELTALMVERFAKFKAPASSVELAVKSVSKFSE